MLSKKLNDKEKLIVAINEYLMNFLPKNLYPTNSRAQSMIRFANESLMLNKFLTVVKILTLHLP